MKNFITLIVLAFCCLIGGKVYAQQIPVFNQYLYNPYLYNPARAGGDTLGHLFLGYKKQWANTPEAPHTSVLTFDYPLVMGSSGVGVTVYSDNSHIINKIGASFSYAYHIDLGQGADDHRLSLGLSAGFLNQRIDFSNALVKDPNDEAILFNSKNGTAFDVGFGAHYQYKRLNIDVSVPQLSNTNVRYLTDGGQGSSTFELVSHFLGSVAYEIPLGKKEEIALEPVLMVRGAPGLPVQYDANLLFKWYNRLTIGAGWRSGGNEAFASSLNASIGVQIQKLIRFSYTYEIMANSLNRTSLGNSHEFSLGFMFGSNSDRIRKLENEKAQRDKDYREAEAARIKASEDAKAEAAKNPVVVSVPAQQSSRSQLLDDYLLLMILRELQDMQKDRNDEGVQRSEGSVDNRKFKKIGSVFFPYDSYALNDDARKALREVRDELQSRDDVVVLYTAGNASMEGASEYNMILATRRSVAVKNYLNQLGISDMRIMPIPYGAENPITQEQQDESDREKNRRVDIFLLEN